MTTETVMEPVHPGEHSRVAVGHRAATHSVLGVPRRPVTLEISGRSRQLCRRGRPRLHRQQPHDGGLAGRLSASNPSRNSLIARLDVSTCRAACCPCWAMIARSASDSARRPHQMAGIRRHSSRNRCQAEYSHPSGSWPGFRKPRKNARPAHRHHGVARITTVSARSRRRSSVSV